MVDCTKCKHSTEWIEILEGTEYKMYYCSLMDYSLPEVEAKDDLPCDGYDKELDDNQTEE